jgi:phenylpyruvate tautomerase PptA (4-oxalocrotonate tautomerase family)
MPIYSVEIAAGDLTKEQKQELAVAIPDVHHKVTGAGPDLVNVFFYEVDTANRFQGGKPAAMTPVIHCHIRAGKSDLEQRALVSALNDEWSRVTGGARNDLIIAVEAWQARTTMENGRFVPENGDEAAWLSSLHEANA